MDEVPIALSEKAVLNLHNALRLFGLGEVVPFFGCALVFGGLAVAFSRFDGAPGAFVSWAFAFGSAGATAACLVLVLLRAFQHLNERHRRGDENQGAISNVNLAPEGLVTESSHSSPLGRGQHIKGRE